MLARELKKTHAELMNGITAGELERWKLLYKVEAEEREQKR